MFFKSIKKKEFYARFQNDEDCMKYLSELKWSGGYNCRQCGHSHYMKGKKAYSRRCKQCKYDESVTSHTIFHKLKFGLEKAFEIIFLMTTNIKGMSAHSLSQELGLRYETCLNFRRKVHSAMQSSQLHPLKGHVEVDETAIGGYDAESQGRAKGDKKLVSIALEIVGEGQMGRAYAVPIEDYSYEQLKKIFESHIDERASVRTDKWSGYVPLKETFTKLLQEPSEKGGNFKELHLHIMNLKNWLRGIHHHVSEKYIKGYLDEFHFRFNRRAFRKGIFHRILEKMMTRPPICYSELLV